MDRKEIEKAILETENALLLLKLDKIFADIKDLAIDSISEGMHCTDFMGEVTMTDHNKFLKSVIELYLESLDD